MAFQTYVAIVYISLKMFYSPALVSLTLLMLNFLTFDAQPSIILCIKS